MRLFFLSFLLLVGCAQEDQPKAVLRLCFNTQPNTIDPRKCSDFISSTLVCMVYEGLTRCLPGEKVEPALAKSVEILEDETHYVFHLRKAYWSNQEPITAFDFERSWKEIIESAGPCVFLFYPIKNAELAARGQISIDAVGIRAIDAETLSVKLERPTAYFYTLTAFPSFLAAPPRPNIYSGPFQIEKMVYNNEIVLVKNIKFWNEKNIHLDKIHISIVPDEVTALHMFERGDLDWIGGNLSPLPPDAIEKIKGKIHYVSTAGSTLCTFNTQEFPFQNLHMRKAFSFAIDREEIVQEVAQGEGIAAQSILPPAFSKQSFVLTDRVAALFHFEKGLSELGLEPKDVKITLNFRSNQIGKRLAQTLQKRWEDLFGIRVELLQLDFKTHAKKLQSKNYQIALASWIAQFEDPVSILDRFKHADHLKNYPGWENTDYLKFLVEAENSKMREEPLAKAEQILKDELPLTPIYHWNAPVICSERIKKIATSPCGGVLFERFEISEP